MADTKISALTALVGTGVDTAADVLPIVDTSATTTKKILVDELRIALLSNTALTNSLAADVALNNTGSYFTGPSVAQGSTGTWFASGTVTLSDPTQNVVFNVKLWDGTSVIDSAVLKMNGAGSGSEIHCVSLSGYLASPAGNIRISVNDSSNTTGLILFNSSGNSKDSTISVFRIG